MKEVLRQFIQDSLNELALMKKSEMNTSDRVAYERAKSKLDAAQRLLNACNVDPK